MIRSSHFFVSVEYLEEEKKKNRHCRHVEYTFPYGMIITIEAIERILSTSNSVFRSTPRDLHVVNI